MQKALPPASCVQCRSACGVVSARRRRSRFANNGSLCSLIVSVVSAFGSSAEGGGYSGFRWGTVGMAPTSRVPGFGPRLELSFARFCSTGQGIDRAGPNLTHRALASMFLARLFARGISLASAERESNVRGLEVSATKRAAQISVLEEKLRQLKAREQAAEARRRSLESRRKRKDDTRRKILVGAIVLAKVEQGEFPEARQRSWLDAALTRADDRGLFELTPIGGGST